MCILLDREAFLTCHFEESGLRIGGPSEFGVVDGEAAARVGQRAEGGRQAELKVDVIESSSEERIDDFERRVRMIVVFRAGMSALC